MTARTDGPAGREAGVAGSRDGGSPGEDPAAEPDRREADRRVVRRALTAGAITTLLISVVSLAVAVGTGSDGAVAGVWVTSGVVVGALVASGWLVLSLGLDLVAGVVPGRRRVIWTLVVFACAFISPILPAAMLQIAATR